jgi:hypothetical protein
MNLTSKLIAIAATLFTVSTARAEPDAKATYQDIQKTLGLGPRMKAFPQEESLRHGRARASSSIRRPLSPGKR